MFARLERIIVYLAVLDLLGTKLALWGADLARRFLPFGQELGAAASFLNPTLHLIVALVYPITFLALGVYDLRRDTRPVGDPFSLTRALVVGIFIFAGVLYFSYRDVPRLLVLYFAGAQLASGCRADPRWSLDFVIGHPDLPGVPWPGPPVTV